MDDLRFALHITAPVFFILSLGMLFKRLGWINDAFARMGSDLVFKVTLPCLLFVKLVRVDFGSGLPLTLVLYALIATLAVFLALDLWVAPRLKTPEDRGVFVQGAFRGNMGIIGLAFCLSAFGDEVLKTASIYLAVMTALFNVLAVVTLTRHQVSDAPRRNIGRVMKGIASNPLILAILAGVALSLGHVEVPQILLGTGETLAGMTLPLALLCAGASIRLHEFRASPSLYGAVTGKLLVVPLLISLGGAAIGLRGASLGVLYLMSASPTAAASYPMAQSMRGNHHLAAAIIAASSLGSMVSTTLGIFLLRRFALI